MGANRSAHYPIGIRVNAFLLVDEPRGSDEHLSVTGKEIVVVVLAERAPASRYLLQRHVSPSPGVHRLLDALEDRMLGMGVSAFTTQRRRGI